MTTVARVLLALAGATGTAFTVWFVARLVAVNPGGVVVGLGFVAVLLVVAWLVAQRIWPDQAGWPFVASVGWGGLCATAAVIAFSMVTTSSAFVWRNGALAEEVAKALGILLIFGAFTQLNRAEHGLLIGAFVGWGYQLVENVGYGAVGSSISGAMDTWLTRLALTAFLHAMFSALVGWGIGHALYGPHRLLALIAIAAGVGLHVAWNLEAAGPLARVVVSVVGYAAVVWLWWRQRDRLSTTT